MKSFNHINVKSVKDASAAMSDGKSRLNAGGTDLIGTLKDNILPVYPATVINLKSVPGLDYIKEEDGMLKIGALTRLSDISENTLIKEKFTALAQAARAVATPHIREMGTISGTIAQLPRCWYFRKPENRFPCNRKGGKECFAILGDNRYHSIFGGSKTHTSPCTDECPAGTDIPGYFAQIRSGNWDEAARIFMKVNPMPCITGRICAHPCQKGCNRCQTDESVSIRSVERKLGDYVLENSAKFYTPPTKETGKSVAIVGSGPAGLCAAFYLRKAGNKVTVYDVKPEAGGMLMYSIPAYRLPKDIVRKFIKALEGMGIIFQLNTKIGVDVKPEDLENNYDSVCFATGAWKRPVLGLSGESMTVFGLDFLVDVRKWMEGKIGSEVFVMGGGSVAMDVAITAKRLGAKKVTLACLEPKDRMPASSEDLALADKEGIIIMPSWGLSQVIEENGIAKGIELKRCVSPWDSTGRFNPQYDENEKIIVNADNFLMSTGQGVDLSYLGDKYKDILTPRGLIDVSQETYMTSREGIFAAGDATGPGLAIKAIANGHKAANGMNRYLGTDSDGENTTSYDFSSKPVSCDTQKIHVKVPMKLKEVEFSKRSLDVEDSFTPSLEEAAAEASRCMNCGCYAVHPSDVAPALVALDAKIVTNKRTIDIEKFFDARVLSNTVLAYDEIITEIQVPAPAAGSKSTFIKFATRKAIDFPIVNVAVQVSSGSARICLNAVSSSPYRALEAEKVIAGKKIDETTAEAAGIAAVKGALPFEANRYKVQIAKTLVKRALLALR
jgi:NADPH-dependent glutamate synthase beta subunit-like oxidoreductase/CO/xanthine dehydrogenase FAD-binding subunit